MPRLTTTLAAIGALAGALALTPAQTEPAVPAAVAGADDTVSLAMVTAGPDEVQVLATSFDLTEHGQDGEFGVVLHPGDSARLDALGLRYRVVIEDLLTHDLEVRRSESVSARTKDPAALLPGETMTGYRTLSQYESDLRSLAEANPGFVRLFELPLPTHEGRTVLGIEIAGDVERAATDGRPTSLLMGVHHAREWPSGELTIMFAFDLIEAYNAGDPGIVDLVDATRLIVVPVVNPDGFVRSRELVSDFVAPLPGAAALVAEFAYHRKNLRHHGGNGITGQGVDPNRNYPYKWGGAGASGSPNSATYYGPGPGSEPEIENVLQLLRREQVLTLISNHTYGDLVLRPFGDTHRDTPDESWIKGHADAMAAINGYDSIKGLDLYATTGTTEDWVYGATGAFSYTFEIGDSGAIGLGNVTPVDCAGFHPQYHLCIPRFYELNRGAFLLNLQAARDTRYHSVLTGTAAPGTVLTLDKAATIPLSLPFEGEDVRTERLSSSIVVGPDGRYTWHVNPSALPQTLLDIEDGVATPADRETYTLTAALPDGRTITRRGLLVERGRTYQVSFPRS